MTQHYHAIVGTPFAALGLRLERQMLAAIDFLPLATWPQAAVDAAAQRVVERLQRYLLHPHCAFELPLAPRGTPFQQRVWQAILAIPAGQALTYSELAQQVGSGPRAVANACGANPIPVIIPCHRVVAKGGLGGFMQGRETASLSIKQWLLAHERGEPYTAG